MTSEATRQCDHCGDEFEAGSGASRTNGVKKSGLKNLDAGQTVSADELFEFEEAYCSMDCAPRAGESDGE